MTPDKRKRNEPPEEDTFKSILEEVAEKGKSLLSEGFDQAREIFDDKKELIREKAGELKAKKVGEVAQDVKRFVKENPWTSVAIGVGVGLILGTILKSDD